MIDKIIQKRFEEAGLLLKFKTIDTRNSNVFGAKIGRKIRGNQRSEFFEMQLPDDPEIRVEVLDTRNDICQVLLLVKEPRRFVVDRLMDRTGKKLIREVRRQTNSATRKFLMGLDERQLFMCQVDPRSKSVEDAHSRLKAPAVTLAEGRVSGKTIRQGEWFFLNVTDGEKAICNETVKGRGKGIYRRNASINEAVGKAPGKAHIAEEMVVADGLKLEHGFGVRGRPEVYVRGKISHPDHYTTKFKEWRKVIRNREERAGVVGQGARTWID